MTLVTPETRAYARWHLRLGWWALAGWLVLGLTLEGLHGLKVGWYLDPGAETRRLLWTLAHAHGALLGLVHVAFGATVLALPGAGWGRLESRCLTAGALLLPLGFLLGGVVIHGGDPGLPVLLVPPGALCLAVGVVATARRASRAGV